MVLADGNDALSPHFIIGDSLAGRVAGRHDDSIVDIDIVAKSCA